MTPINIPFALVPTIDLSAYGPIRTFHYVAAGSSPGASKIKIWGSGDGVNFPPVTATPLVELGGESQPKTINDLSRRYRAQVTGTGGVVATVDVTTDCCNDVLSQFNTLALPDFPTGGEVTTSTNVDQFAAFTIDQRTPGQTLTFPPPTDTDPTYVRWVSNIGTESFALYGLVILPDSGTKIVWNGSLWFNGCTGTASSLRTVVAAAGVGILDTDAANTLLGNIEADVPGNTLQLFAGAGGGSWTVDGGGALTVDASGSIEMFPGTAGSFNIRPRVGAGNVGKLRLFELTINGGNSIGIKTADAVAASVDYTLPEAPALNNQSLTSTTAGVMSWRGATDVAAGNASGQAIADGAGPAIVTGWTEAIDTAAAFVAATGIFTAPVTGVYHVTAQVEYAASVAALNAEFSIQIYVNGVLAALGAAHSQVAVGASAHQARVAYTVPVTVGQTIDIRAAQNGGAGAVSLTPNATRNLLSISLVT